jgi:hypothetical protein
MRPDYEVPAKAVVDYLEQRDDVDPQRGSRCTVPLWDSLLAARTAAFEKRLCACICDGLVVDVYEAWRPYDIEDRAPGIRCPLLVLYGEAELAQSSVRCACVVILTLSKHLSRRPALPSSFEPDFACARLSHR